MAADVAAAALLALAVAAARLLARAGAIAAGPVLAGLPGPAVAWRWRVTMAVEVAALAVLALLAVPAVFAQPEA